ncbi:hypothetical protein AVEN_148012-1 [Araneus ventricosus]|uniref:Uncharacterized protein n=1 Tax=Araneus ventricosus TaxID=182803 RepID=A0A4Y2S1T7_ARAVE|nr:hypothetical protein AVEN_148012-1 [Araneus ventricosus]
MSSPFQNQESHHPVDSREKNAALRVSRMPNLHILYPVNRFGFALNFDKWLPGQAGFTERLYVWCVVELNPQEGAPTQLWSSCRYEFVNRWMRVSISGSGLSGSVRFRWGSPYFGRSCGHQGRPPLVAPRFRQGSARGRRPHDHPVLRAGQLQVRPKTSYLLQTGH